ncbi:uncharacterized protein B0H18DRAFT_502484 [Fomitopsis serialis]|uniref:uncharacterized protein n=1 Tax=Fomitopsis serialis TaxID=139415 RepID=UPI0020082BFB|nr:uncharacterized protein B0H18DRAFT_502484 [Neoantrodia serialis]KAH9922723.1 hypothetical protein B0H18DRAFT_502484 [Neoantrodia serialis]
MAVRRIIWYIFIGCVVCAIIVSVVVLPLALPVALGAIGFLARGVLRGSIAAGIQSSIGPVSAGSPFALAQSVAMGGAIPALWSSGATVVGGAVGGLLGWTAAWLEPIFALHTRYAMRGAKTVLSRATRGVRRLVSCVRSRL